MDHNQISDYLSQKRKIANATGELSKAFKREGYHFSEASIDCLLYLGSLSQDSSTARVLKGEFSQTLRFKNADITRATRKLEDEGLIVDDRGTVDRRTRNVGLTDKGRDLYRRIISE